MTIKQIMKAAHEYASSIGAYDCEECLGSGYYYDKAASYEGYSIKVVCEDCGGTGKAPKYQVIAKMHEELPEFANAERSEEPHKDSEECEIADMLFVLLGYCEEVGIDIERAIKWKLDCNKKR